MEYKLKIIIIPILALIFSLICANAIMPVPKIELEEYEITTSDKSKVYIEGTVSIAKGQQVTARMENSYSSIPIVATKLGSSGGKENFQLKIPAAYLSEGTNKFYVRSEGLRKVIHPSNMREVVVKISSDSGEKKAQTISASNKSVQVGKTVSLGAKASSGLPLTYSSSNTGIATVNNKGVVTGKKAGVCKITITQNGNNEYKSATKVVTIVVVKPAALKPSNTGGTYTIVYNGGSNIGISDVTGKMTSQKVKIGTKVALKNCGYKKKGYKFVGWAIKAGRANKNGSTSIDKFKNINMKHFQLGKVKYKNKAKVKNLAKKGKTITLYAVWKGNGPEAAVDWGYIIAADNSFRYGNFDRSSSKWTKRKGNRNHRKGCYFCKTNRKEPHGDYGAGKSSKPYDINKSWYNQSKAQKYDRTWCCNPFIVACYVHGANEKKKCGSGSMSYGSWTSHKGNGKFKKASSKSLKPGDVFFSGGHVWMYAGKKNGKKVVLQSTGSTWKKSSIRWNYDSSPGSGSKGRVRYYPK